MSSVHHPQGKGGTEGRAYVYIQQLRGGRRHKGACPIALREARCWESGVQGHGGVEGYGACLEEEEEQEEDGNGEGDVDALAPAGRWDVSRSRYRRRRGGVHLMLLEGQRVWEVGTEVVIDGLLQGRLEVRYA